MVLLYIFWKFRLGENFIEHPSSLNKLGALYWLLLGKIADLIHHVLKYKNKRWIGVKYTDFYIRMLYN